MCVCVCVLQAVFVCGHNQAPPLDGGVARAGKPAAPTYTCTYLPPQVSPTLHPTHPATCKEPPLKKHRHQGGMTMGNAPGVSTSMHVNYECFEDKCVYGAPQGGLLVLAARL